MESLQSFFPYCKANDNFWMKYSMATDGASMHTFLERAGGSKYSVLAIETADGEVFGAFTTESWRKARGAFGGGETFLWRLRNPRRRSLDRDCANTYSASCACCSSFCDIEENKEDKDDIIEENSCRHLRKSSTSTDPATKTINQCKDSFLSSSPPLVSRMHSVGMDNIVRMESEIDVFPYSGDNDFIQICSQDTIAIGGNDGSDDDVIKSNDSVPNYDSDHYHPRRNGNKTISTSSSSSSSDYGLCIHNDMQRGRTSSCATFRSPPLSKRHADGSTFEIMNLELWTLTPCTNEKDAGQLEKELLFMEKQRIN